MAIGKQDLIRLQTAFLAAAMLVVPTVASAQTVSGLFGFGDSLTDTHIGFDLTPVSSQPFLESASNAARQAEAAKI